MLIYNQKETKGTKQRTDKEIRIMLVNGVEYKEHHTALCKGYVSVKKNSEEPKPYVGRFGKGYTVKSHNSESTRFCFITYYVA